jgi:hypothetical protein
MKRNTDDLSSTRKRGGQPGNANALRHGFYCRKFRKIELEDLDQLAQGLEAEIAALRVYARRMVEAAAEKADEMDLDDQRAIVTGLGTAFIRIASLMRTHAMLTDGSSPLERTLATALAAIQEEVR